MKLPECSLKTRAEYFDNPDLQGNPVLVEKDILMRMFWRTGNPAEGMPEDGFSVRWSGTLIPPSGGSYAIGIFSDVRGRLILDGKVLIDSWDPYVERFSRMDTVTFEQGKEYKIVMEYADISAYAGIRLIWQKLNEADENEAMIAEAVEAARESDAAILIAGISPILEGEEMRVSMEVEGVEGATAPACNCRLRCRN